MQVLVISRAASMEADVEDDPALDEEHWSYMDGFVDGMIARGPLLAADRSSWTGSMHIVELPSVEAAAEFVDREPYNRAGLYAQHGVWRFRTALDRSMWEWKSPQRRNDPLFVVTALMRAGAGDFGVALPTLTPAVRHRTIVLGELLTLDGAKQIGVVWALQAHGRAGLDTLLAAWPAAQDEQTEIETHDWEFGGRR